MRLGFIASAFDPCPHCGMIWAIEQAVEKCQLDGVIAAVHVDPSVERKWKRSPSTPLDERVWMVRSLKWVKLVLTYDTETALAILLNEYRPHIVILGEDHKDDEWTGKDLGLTPFFAKRKAGWSGTDFVKRIRGLQ